VGKIRYKGKILATRKWIGAFEAASYIRSLGVPASVLDFSDRRNSTSIPKKEIFKFVWDHFYPNTDMDTRLADQNYLSSVPPVS